MIVYAYEEKLKLNMVFLNYNFRIKELQENNIQVLSMFQEYIFNW